MGFIARLVFASFIAAPPILYAADRLIFAIDLIRHGDRTPLMLLPAAPYQWPEGMGQLTAEGMKQEYQLGRAFRKKYVEETHLLPKYYESGTIHVRSTAYDRTLMSAQSLLLGLYPSHSAISALPYHIQPIPIINAPAQYDTVIIQQVSPQERARLMEEYVYSTAEWQQKEHGLKGKFPLWSRLTGIPIKHLEQLETLGNTLAIHQLHQAPLPEGLSAEDIQTITDARDWVFTARERPVQIGKAYSTKLMRNILTYLDNASQHRSPIKYVLLSAHDTSIARMMSFLGAPLEKAPPYASDLNFSLYEQGPNHVTVTITYNGNQVSIPVCGGTVCDVQQLRNLL